MTTEATSKNIRGATELTPIAPIKPDFVPGLETLSYAATRLRRLLGGVVRAAQGAGGERRRRPPQWGHRAAAN
jgi:hypothetical protein